nr:hypothetical protein [Galdieria sp.]WDA99666.1 hypothetical protein GASUdbv011_124 [Galdieria sulphuraria]
MYSSRMAYIFSVLYLKSYSQYYNNTFVIKPFNIFSSYIRRRIFILLLAELETLFHDVNNIKNYKDYLSIVNNNCLNELLFEVLRKVINNIFALNYKLDKSQFTSWWLTQKFLIENENFLVFIENYIKQFDFDYTEINYLLETIILNLMDYISKFFFYTIFTNNKFELVNKQKRLTVCYYLLLNDVLTYYLSLIQYSYFNKCTLFIFSYNGKLKYKHSYKYDKIYNRHRLRLILYLPLSILIILLFVYNIKDCLSIFKADIKKNKN